MPLAGAVAIAGIVALVLLIARRAGELFLVSIKNGEALTVRGRIPKSLLSAFREVARHESIRRATVRGVMENGAPRLVVTGVDDGTAQQLRNSFSVHPLSKLRSARPPANRNLGQILGFAWLAWLLLGLRHGS